jgi:hypothetical protein
MPPVVGAGFVTTACLLSWLIYSLCTYEGTQDRLLQELVHHGVTEDTTWDPDFADSLPYLNKFIKETQRYRVPGLDTRILTMLTSLLLDCITLRSNPEGLPRLSVSSRADTNFPKGRP